MSSRTAVKSDNILKYKGYSGHVEYDDEAGIFHGDVLDLEDVITFQGMTVDEVERAFRDSIDDYLEFCQQRGEEPDKPFSGRLMLRLPPNLHRKVYVSALREGKSLNQWIAERLERAC
jgi:predicted HicB family RNase H-like nuclease